MIKNIVFDIGGVLAGFPWEEFYRSFGCSDEVFEKLADATVRSPLWNEVDRGKLSDEELLEGLIKNDPSVEKEIREIFKNIKGMVSRYDYAIPWIRELKERGFRVYVISNFGHRAHMDCIDALDFLEEIDGGILSYQVKLIKPSPEIYQCLLRKYDLKPEECIFIDDLYKNVEAAKKEGMQGIVFETPEQVKKELEALPSPAGK